MLPHRGVLSIMVWASVVSQRDSTIFLGSLEGGCRRKEKLSIEPEGG